MAQIKIRDEFRFTTSDVTPVGGSVRFPINVRSIDVKGLIGRLNEKGVPVKEEDSEREVSYQVEGNLKSTIIPLDVDVNGRFETKSYRLRSEGLDIVVRNYYNSQSLNPTPGLIGGSVRQTVGIIYRFSYEGRKTDIQERIDLAKEVISGFHNIPLDMWLSPEIMG